MHCVAGSGLELDDIYSTNNSCAATLSSNNASNLPTIFTQIATSLSITKPRLL